MDRWRPEDGRSWYFWFVFCVALGLGALFVGLIVAPFLVNTGTDLYHQTVSSVQRLIQSVGL